MGAVLHYYCREGFNLVGTASQQCLPIGEWSSYTPLCMQGESVVGTTVNGHMSVIFIKVVDCTKVGQLDTSPTSECTVESLRTL